MLNSACKMYVAMLEVNYN